MIEYVNPLWAKKLSQFHLKGFADFWDTENHWFEEVNQRRDGWSGGDHQTNWRSDAIY